MFERLARQILRRPVRVSDVDPASGYDLWSSTYDRDTENVLMVLDERMFEGLLRRVPLGGKSVIDVGCGTGRHWKKILAGEPAALVGYDVSAGMLARLRQKYPGAIAHQGNANHLAQTPDASCDLVVSTLTLSHVPAVEDAIAECSRISRPGGDILLTDFHPAASATCECGFRHQGQVVTVKVYAHPVASLEAAAARHALEVLALEEARLDETERPYYEKRGMLRVFERMKDVPLLYGLHLRKADSKSP
jgi:ubiquinone/menaquinone biosynthesis C-methylase UbiE